MAGLCIQVIYKMKLTVSIEMKLSSISKFSMTFMSITLSQYAVANSYKEVSDFAKVQLRIS